MIYIYLNEYLTVSGNRVRNEVMIYVAGLLDEVPNKHLTLFFNGSAMMCRVFSGMKNSHSYLNV